MLEKALTGNRGYWGWIILLLGIFGLGFAFFLHQLDYGLGVTGLSRDVSWGLYIANFTFFVGVAASAVMVVLPYYLHNYKKFGRIVALGEFLAVSAVAMCMLFVVVDLGQPGRLFNIILHPSPRSVMFWDVMILGGYLLLNIVIAWTVLDAEHRSDAPPAWIKPIILLSIPWAVSIHTVTALLYNGLAARPFWLTAVLAPRFLASAFASGPALLIIMALIIRRFSRFDPGSEAIQKLAQIVTYAMITSVFFLMLEFFTAFYSGMPEHTIFFEYLWRGVDGKGMLVPWIWTSIILAFMAIALLINPRTRRNENILALACVMVFISIWIDKGLGLIVPGFIPSPTGEITEYWPSMPEGLITLGIWALGFLILSVLYKIAIAVVRQRQEA
jgi:molybdopterin-containing oxidoreductase family membrane subunit